MSFWYIWRTYPKYSDDEDDLNGKMESLLWIWRWFWCLSTFYSHKLQWSDKIEQPPDKFGIIMANQMEDSARARALRFAGKTSILSFFGSKVSIMLKLTHSLQLEWNAYSTMSCSCYIFVNDTVGHKKRQQLYFISLVCYQLIWINSCSWPLVCIAITPLKNVARGYFLIPAELISSHLQSLVNIRPSLARQSHTRVMMIRCNYQTLFYVKWWWSTGHKEVLHFWKEGTQGFSIGNQGPSVVSKGNHQYHHNSDQRIIDS